VPPSDEDIATPTYRTFDQAKLAASDFIWPAIFASDVVPAGSLGSPTASTYVR
jgi:hypothetical protein